MVSGWFKGITFKLSSFGVAGSLTGLARYWSAAWRLGTPDIRAARGSGVQM